MRKYSRSAAGLTMVVGALTAGAQAPPPAQASHRSYTARLAIELTAPRAAQFYVQSVAGGQAVADVVTQGATPGSITKAHVGRVTFAPITVRGSAAELLTEFRSALDQPAAAFDGSILQMDYDDNIHAEMSFARARLTQIVLSALDAASKDATTAELTLVPEQVHVSAAREGQSFASRSQREKASLLGFRLQMPGLDDAMNHVARVDAIRLMQTGPTNAAGVAEYVRGAPGRWTNGNVVLTLPLAHAQELSRWQKQLVVGHSDSLVKTLDVHLLAGMKELLVLHGTGVSLVSMRDMKAQANGETWALVQAELVVQHWDIGQP